MDDGAGSVGGSGGGDGGRRRSWREAELQRLVADIAARLRNSCADLSDEEFSKLVLDIAQRRLRFELGPSGGPDSQPARPD